MSEEELKKILGEEDYKYTEKPHRILTLHKAAIVSVLEGLLQKSDRYETWVGGRNRSYGDTVEAIPVEAIQELIKSIGATMTPTEQDKEQL